jgi:AspT/YidE/YbjL antiporter-like protein
MDWVVTSLRANPELAVFLTLAIGFSIGRLRVGSFRLGSVVGTLLAGVLVGQLDVRVDPLVKLVFFDLFLFATGYKVGPQFFRGLKKNAASQALLTLVLCTVSLATTVAAAKVMGYDCGTAAGLLAGAFTESTVIGTAGNTISRLPLTEGEISRLMNRRAAGARRGTTRMRDGRSAPAARSRTGRALSSAPHDLDLVVEDPGVGGQERAALELCLCDQEAVERVAVMRRQPGDAEGVRVLDGERVDAVLRELLGNEALGRRGQLELAEPHLDRDLPGARRREQEGRAALLEQRQGRRAEALGAEVPPQPALGVDEGTLHLRNPARTSGGRGALKSSAMRPLPTKRPARLLPRALRAGTSRATGSPAREMRTSSPASTRASSRERWVLASCTLTSVMGPGWTKFKTKSSPARAAAGGQGPGGGAAAAGSCRRGHSRRWR